MIHLKPDYVIIRGGSADLVLTSRLSQDTSRSISPEGGVVLKISEPKFWPFGQL